MPIPEFLRRIRERIGTERVLLPAVSAAVLDDQGRLLTMLRADTRDWSIPSGIAEPGEAPADTIVRELYEEAGLHVVPERVLAVFHTPDLHYPNGDVATYVTTLFRCRVSGGKLEARDGEALDLRWRQLDDLPPIRQLDWLPAPLPNLLAGADGPAVFACSSNSPRPLS